MGNFNFNEDGVPILSATEIEKKAEEVIEYFNPAVTQSPCETPLLSFYEGFAKNFDFTYDLLQDLGENSYGQKLLGKFIFKPRKILIDKSISGDLRQKFVLAHELGHLILHRKITVKRSDYQQDFSDTKKDLVTGHKYLVAPRDWLEWQANRFASAILIPRQTLPAALISVQKSLDIHRNLGRIYLDEQPNNYAGFRQTLEGLKNIYQVTKTTLEYRLTDLGLLLDVRGKSTKHISELFMEE